MKLLVGLNKKDFSLYLNYTNSFIIGLKDFSINYTEFSLKEIKEIREKYPNCEIFVSLNKNIFNKDLEELEKILLFLDEIKINGILFYDLSILSISKKHHLSIPLIWGQEHMTTNYNTCNYYLNKGCSYVYLSSEITKDEIEEIKCRSKVRLISFLFGYPDVSFSKRKLLTNYFLYHNEKMNQKEYEIISDDQKYLIQENNLGTRILHKEILNGIKPFHDLMNILDYAILSEEFIEHEVFMEVLKTFYEFMNHLINEDEAFNKIKELTGSDNTGFYYKKTIYKVKDEK